MKYLISILLVITFLSCSQEETLTPTKILSLKQGDLVGYEKEDTEYFLGVPYAEAPVKDYRFKTPQSLEGWDGVLNAQSASKTCIQAQEGDGLLGRFAEIFINYNYLNITTYNYLIVFYLLFVISNTTLLS